MFAAIDIGKLDVVSKRFFYLKTLLIIMTLQHQNRIYQHNIHLFINVNNYTKNEERLLPEITINNTNTRSNSFYIQNVMVCEMFLCMANVMKYDIRHFLQIIEHPYVMYNKLFFVYNTLDAVKMYAFRISNFSEVLFSIFSTNFCQSHLSDLDGAANFRNCLKTLLV